jgi:TRAP-type C4-dicarboxylate transport system substrate-binding protein
MRNRVIIIICALVLIIPGLLVACAGPSAQTAKATENKTAQVVPQETIVLRTAVMYPANNPFTVFAEEYAKMVLKATEGRVKLVVSPGESLCPGAEELSSVNSGSVDAAMTVISYVVGQVPLANLGALPWVGISDIEKSTAACVEVLPVMQKGFEKYNINMLWYTPSPSAYGLATKKQVHVPDEAKGLKIRSAGGAMDKLIQGWGATTVTVPTSEMYQSIQNGITDGTLLTATSIASFKLNEIAPYYCDLDIGINGFMFYVNKNKWDKISKADQAAINAIQADYIRQVFTMNKSFIQKARASYPKIGETAYVPTAEEMKLWKAPAREIWEKYMASSPEAKQAADIFLKYGGGYE